MIVSGELGKHVLVSQRALPGEHQRQRQRQHWRGRGPDNWPAELR